MALADSLFNMTLQNVHPGGFLWNIPRSERDQVVLRLATQAKQLAVIAHTERDAEAFAERLTLSGLPVFLATDSSRSGALETEVVGGSSTLVATHDFVVSHGPIRVPLAVHLRVTNSVRLYARRLDAILASAHVSFVTPEDEARARSLSSYLRNDRGHDEVIDVTLDEVIDLTDSATSNAAAVSGGRRRFPMRD